MKKIILILVIVATIFMGCAKGEYVIAVEDGLSYSGIEIWGPQIKTIKTTDVIGDVFGQPDCYIYLDKNLNPNGAGNILGQTFDCNPCMIKVKMNNAVIIAHEIGHFLGRTNNEEYGSIMFPSTEFTNKPLNWFTEFGGTNTNF